MNGKKSPQKSTSSKTAELTATVGPASFGKETELLRAGATRLRFNASHMGADELVQHVTRIRKQAPDARFVIDLQGTKMRLGSILERSVHEGEEVTFARSTDICPTGIHLPHDAFFETIRPKDIFSIGDGDLSFRVLRTSHLSCTACAQNGGTILSQKGVTILGKAITNERLSVSNEEKIEAIVKGVGSRGISWALSFVSRPQDIDELRDRLPKNAKVIAKIERQAAIDVIDDISSAADAFWICRGDLGEQIGLCGMAKFIANFDPKQFPIASVLAGQVLHHMLNDKLPTRAEICHLYDAMAKGYRGIVLSDETALGLHPVHTVETARDLLDQFVNAR